MWSGALLSSYRFRPTPCSTLFAAGCLLLLRCLSRCLSPTPWSHAREGFGTSSFAFCNVSFRLSSTPIQLPSLIPFALYIVPQISPLFEQTPDTYHQVFLPFIRSGLRHYGARAVRFLPASSSTSMPHHFSHPHTRHLSDRKSTRLNSSH